MTTAIARVVPATKDIPYTHIERLCDVGSYEGWSLYPLPIDLTNGEVDKVLERFDKTDPALKRQIVATLIQGMITAGEERDTLTAKLAKEINERGREIVRLREALLPFAAAAGRPGRP